MRQIRSKTELGSKGSKVPLEESRANRIIDSFCSLLTQTRKWIFAFSPSFWIFSVNKTKVKYDIGIKNTAITNYKLSDKKNPFPDILKNKKVLAERKELKNKSFVHKKGGKKDGVHTRHCKTTFLTSH